MDRDGRPRGRIRGHVAAVEPLFLPSGEDANPLNRRLPAEVVSRRRSRRTEEVVDEDLELDLKAVLALKAEARPKWLAKACRLVEDGRASASELYNIVSSRKLVAGVPDKVGRKLAGLVREHLALFSEKQQRFLQSRECALVASYSEKPEQARGNSDGEGADAAARMEEMMARCRAFVREKASTFDARTVECEEAERKATEKARYEREHAGMDAEDLRTHQRRREAEELARRVALEAEERKRREERERAEREQRLAHEAELARRQELLDAQVRRKLLESDVDSSMKMLERKNAAAAAAAPAAAAADRGKSAKAAKDNRGRGLSRSRSISSRGAKRGRKKDGSEGRSSSSSDSSKGRKNRKRSASRHRDRRKRGSRRRDSKKRRRKRSSSSSSSRS